MHKQHLQLGKHWQARKGTFLPLLLHGLAAHQRA